MDETQEKCVIKIVSKEKIGNTINQLDLLHTPFIDHGDNGGSSPVPRIRNDLLVAWRGMEDPQPEVEDLPIVAVVVAYSFPADEALFPSPTG